MIRKKHLNSRIQYLLCSVLGAILLAGCVSNYGSDNLLSPNWENRHAAFRGKLIDGSVGQEFRRGCSRGCQSSAIDVNVIRYTFVDQPRKGCTYWYDVDKLTNLIVDAQFRGDKEACSLTLN